MDFGLFTLFGAGIFTFFTPCVLPLIPIYLAVLLGGKREGAGRFASVLPALLFILGFSIVFVLLGLGASSIGVLLASHKTLFSTIAGLLVLLFGLKFLGVLKIGFLERDTRYTGNAEKTRFQSINAFLMGFFFAAGWTPCVGPVLGSVLTWTAVNTHSAIQGALYLGVFSAGFAVPMLAAAIFTAQTQKLFNKVKPHLPKLERALGAVMVILAIALLVETLAPVLKSSPQGATEEVVIAETVEQIPGHRITMIEFYSPDCPACRMVAPTVQKVKSDCSGQHVDMRFANVKDPSVHGMASALRITALPTFVFLNEEGNEVGRFLGVQPESKFRNTLTQLTGQPCKM